MPKVRTNQCALAGRVDTFVDVDARTNYPDALIFLQAFVSLQSLAARTCSKLAGLSSVCSGRILPRGPHPPGANISYQHIHWRADARILTVTWAVRYRIICELPESPKPLVANESKYQTQGPDGLTCGCNGKRLRPTRSSYGSDGIVESHTEVYQSKLVAYLRLC